jgi:hypothetical protein
MGSEIRFAYKLTGGEAIRHTTSVEEVCNFRFNHMTGGMLRSQVSSKQFSNPAPAGDGTGNYASIQIQRAFLP